MLEMSKKEYWKNYFCNFEATIKEQGDFKILTWNNREIAQWKMKFFFNENKLYASWYIGQTNGEAILAFDEEFTIDLFLEINPKEFVKKYVESYNSGIPITNILVEYELGFNGVNLSKDGIKNINIPSKIKVDENDNIIIKGKKLAFMRNNKLISKY